MAKAIMIQGTMSNVGKSLLTAGLCRVFRQDGYRVAPFKSQNMALNSGITADGLEMGRAQMMQAEACGIAPDVRMNPILLKPVTDVGSQVIVNGRVLGNMKAADYFRYKQKLIPDIMQAYQSLAAEYDIIVLEGAGSPAEINLKQDDIVNMNMAKWAGAPVLLVGDIDRGGVFAQLVGTMLLLEPEEQQRVKGLVINKFRGDAAILEPGLRQLEEKADVPVVGVMPYVYVDIDEEDSLSTRLKQQKRTAALDVVVIRLPRMANFTDFMALEAEPEVQLRYVTAVQALQQPDMIILPGTKNTISDLLWLRESGLEAAIKQPGKPGLSDFWHLRRLSDAGADPAGPLGLRRRRYNSWLRPAARWKPCFSQKSSAGKLAACYCPAVCSKKPPFRFTAMKFIWAAPHCRLAHSPSYS